MRSGSLKGSRKEFDRPRVYITFWFSLMVLGTLSAQTARAGFVGAFDLVNFTLTNNGGLFPNGYWSSQDSQTLILTGPEDGSGLPGTTDLTIVPAQNSWIHFDYLFTTPDDPGFEYAGYVLSNTFHQLAETNLESGSVLLLLQAGEPFGFRVGSVDNTGGPGVINITDFGPGVPEPGTFTYILYLSGAYIAVWSIRRLKIKLRPVTLIVVVITTLCFAGVGAAQQVFYSGTNVTGQIALTNVVNLRQQAQTPRSGQSVVPLPVEKLRLPPPRLRPPLSSQNVLGAAVAPATVKGLSVSYTPGVPGFNALSHLDQRNANSGNQFSIEPPNQSLAVANGYVMEGVNDAVQIYTTTGSPVLPLVISSNQVFGLGPAINYSTGANGVYLTDMRVFYDQDISRWMVVQRSQDNDISGNPLNQSHLYLAVSQTNDPTGNYNVYLMDTTNVKHPGCPCVDDYPQIGADQYGFHIAWNEFTTFGLQFVDASILTLSKASLGSGGGTPTAIQFLMPYTTGYEFAIQPAMTPPGAANFVGAGGVEYFVSTLSSFAQGSQVALWAMSNTSSLATVSPNPILARIFVPTMSYTFPDVATQRPGYTPLATSQGAALEFLDGGDTRVQSLMYAAGRLHLTLQTGVTDQGGRSVVGGAYMVLSPTYRSGVLAGQVLNQGYLLVNGGNHLLRPAVAVNAQGSGAIGVTLVGTNFYPSAAFIPFQMSSTPSTLQIVGGGALPEDGFTGYPVGAGDGVARWGDYNTAVTASDGSIWMAVQFIGNYPRSQYANWNSYVIHKQP